MYGTASYLTRIAERETIPLGVAPPLLTPLHYPKERLGLAITPLTQLTLRGLGGIGVGMCILFQQKREELA